MTTTDTLIVGGGQAGLAVSHCLGIAGRDHLVVERGQVADRWRNQRWDSLRLLTPNWMTRLPGRRYTGNDPDGFMRAGEVADFLGAYAASFGAPVLDGTGVHRATHDGQRFVVDTDAGTIRSAHLVVATGWCQRPATPSWADHLHAAVVQIPATSYRNPAQLPSGGVLVVGASATGVQLAAELRAAGREVVLAVGRHRRMPRRYRGMDAYWWLDAIGALDRRVDEFRDPEAARREPSVQVVGSDDADAGGRSVDLPALQAAGVHLVGRALAGEGTTVWFGDNLAADAADADRALASVLDRIDMFVAREGLTSEVLAPEAVCHLLPTPPVHRLDLRRAGIGTVIWATGHRRDHRWIDLPILDRHGEIAQRRGVTPVPGAYVVGQRFQHRRNSDSIDGVGRDAQVVVDHITGRRVRPAAPTFPPTTSPTPTTLTEGPR